MKLLVIGANGYVGKAVCAVAKNTEVITAVRGDDLEQKISVADKIVHCANSGKRFFALQNPTVDYQESVIKTLDIKKLCQKHNKKLTMISSISARTQLYHPYGINRRAAESVLDKDDLIIRLGAIFGGDKNVGPLYDVFYSKHVYFNQHTKLACAHIDYLARKIFDLTMNPIDKNLIELGAKSYVVLENFAKHYGSTSTFEGPIDNTVPQDTFTDSPLAEEVYSYFDQLNV
tara:strand:- start:419 stop:1111 length:693 start_codon:yes stop_codon:yes gene_type:complete